MAPSNIIIDNPNEKHRQEWLNSAVAELVIDANLHTITDHRTINHLLGWKTPKGAAGKQSKDDRTCWATWGINPQNRESVYFGVQIKPDNPRSNAEGKPIKYESALGKGEASQPLFLKVPDPIWEKIAAKWSVPILPEDYESDFWQWVINKPQLPVLITEGAKKAASLLSHGFITISVAGVSNGQYLGDINPHIKPFCQVGRRVALAYDSDLHYKKSVRQELDRLGRLLSTSGCVPYVMLWDEATKGIDDVISEFGASELDKIYSTAKTFEAYRREDFEIDGKKEEVEEIETEAHFNQIAIATIYKNQRYICLNDVLHHWTGTHYEPSSDAKEKRRIFRFCNTYKYYDSKLRKYTHRYATETHVLNVLKWFKASCAVDVDDVNPSGLNLLNGVLTIQWKGRTPNPVFKPHDPEIFYTYVSHIKYDPNADPEYCDKLLSVLEPAQQNILLKVLASTLDTNGVRARVPSRSVRCLLLQGTGHNGKDTIREAIKEILGGIFVTSCSLTSFKAFDEGKETSLAPLIKSKINWSPENTNTLLLDKLQVMKSIITGDSIMLRDLYESAKELTPEFAMLFNVNKMPALSGEQDAIKTRYAILSFNKVFVENPNPNNPNELKGDQRYKYDLQFRQELVCPALLNRLLQALTELVTDGIDYSSCDAAIQIAREDSCHLLRWANEIELSEGKGKIRVGDLFNSLKQWYVDQGILDVDQSTFGREKLTWLDEGDRYDPFIKAPNRMRKALEKLFPKATFSLKGELGVFAIGLNSPRFTVLPNFGSVGSGEEEKQDVVSISGADPKTDPNNFGSGNKSGSAIIQQPLADPTDPTDPNYFQADPTKANSINNSDPNLPKSPNLNHQRKNLETTAIKIGDRVEILPPHSLHHQIATVKDIAGGAAKLENSKWAVTPTIPIDRLKRVTA